MKRTLSLLLSVTAMISMLMVSAQAADYSISTTAPQDYYGGTSYEDVYGSQYNYGGTNVVDYPHAACPHLWRSDQQRQPQPAYSQ